MPYWTSRPRDVICTGSFRTFTTDDYQGLTWLSWIFLCIGREASLSSYRPVIVHAWFLATDRALGALVRLSRIRRTGQPKQGSGRFLFFSCCLFYEYWEDGFFHHHIPLGSWSLSRERKNDSSWSRSCCWLDITPLLTSCPTSSFLFHVLALPFRNYRSLPPYI